MIEVLRGVKPSKRSEAKKLLEESFEDLPLDNEVVLKYCEVYDYLKQEGKILPGADLLVVVIALVHNATLVIKDSDFKRVADIGLKPELRED